MLYRSTMEPNFYQKNITDTAQEMRELERRITRNSLLRLCVIVFGGVGIWQLFSLNNVLLVLGAILSVMLLFVYLVFRQSRLDRSLTKARAFYRVNENEINVRNKRQNMYEDGRQFDTGQHPYVSDLDIFGPDSLFSKINRCASADGVRTLANWLLRPGNKEDIVGRQEAVEELKEDPVHMQAFQTQMLFNLDSRHHLKQYLENYFNTPSSSFGGLLYRIYVPLVPWIFLVGLLWSVAVYSIIPYLIVLGIIHFLWGLSQGAKVNRVSNRVDRIGEALVAFGEAVKLIEEKTFDSKLNRDIQQKVKSETKGRDVSFAVHELGKLVDRLDARNNMLLGALLNMFFLWDFKQVRRIERWRTMNKQAIVRACDATMNYEALISLGLLAFNHADWTFPTITDQRVMIVERLRHPMIPLDKSVSNDYNSEDHRVALITGSNMAGKSTFLRTIGINAVLAYSGAVVDARRFELPIFHLLTYMRIKDSLNESTSTFKAELDRLKFILDHVEKVPNSFFLIDEMLRGTNSIDKYLGSKAIIEKLIQLNGRGMLATHDLKLAEMRTEYPTVLKNFHFDIQVQRGEMLFDYKLKEGACTVFNASMLLKEIGISIENKNG